MKLLVGRMCEEYICTIGISVKVVITQKRKDGREFYIKTKL